MIALDQNWLAAHPLPPVEEGTDKNARGRVLVAGGSTTVPGALTLTGEASLRAGAGKILLATVADAALALGIAMPEAGVFGLPANDHGELAAEAGDGLVGLLDRSDCLVLGPGMGEKSDAAPILRRILAADGNGLPTLLDAAVIGEARGCAEAIQARGGNVVLTPHPGEMIALMDCGEDDLRAAPAEMARVAAERFGAVIVLKQAHTWIAAPREEVLRYEGGGRGLATAGSGDVLAGVLGGLLARGMAPRLASAWAVWLHGEAGRTLAENCGAIGFLARELPAHIPPLIAELDIR